MTQVAGPPGPRVIGLDEISIEKGHTYRARLARALRALQELDGWHALVNKTVPG